MPFVQLTYTADRDLPPERVRAFALAVRAGLVEAAGIQPQQLRLTVTRVPPGDSLEWQSGDDDEASR